MPKTLETPEPPEMKRRAQVHLYEAFEAVITRSILEYDLTIADVAGVLECVKYTFLRRMEEEREEGDGDGSK